MYFQFFDLFHFSIWQEQELWVSHLAIKLQGRALFVDLFVNTTPMKAAVVPIMVFMSHTLRREAAGKERQRRIKEKIKKRK